MARRRKTEVFNDGNTTLNLKTGRVQERLYEKQQVCINAEFQLTQKDTHTMPILIRWFINIIKVCGVNWTNVCWLILWSPCHLADRRGPGRVSVCLKVCMYEHERKR